MLRNLVKSKFLRAHHTNKSVLNHGTLQLQHRPFFSGQTQKAYLSVSSRASTTLHKCSNISQRFASTGTVNAKKHSKFRGKIVVTSSLVIGAITCFATLDYKLTKIEAEGHGSLSQRCILAIGNSGNGKSFTATVFGAKDATIGHSSEPGSTEVTIHSIEKGGFYIDTPGFDDPYRKKDEDIINMIYREMLKKNVLNLTTILWFVTPSDRAKDSYKRQATFIESLGKNHKGNVWDNTIIVTKDDKLQDGPRAAAKKIAKKNHNTKDDLLSGTADFLIWLFESLPPTSVYVRVSHTSDELNEYGVYKASEPERILAKYESLMEGHLEHPIHLGLKKVRCSKCSEETDPRFASSKCHDIEWVHPETEHGHDGNIKASHLPLSLFYKHTNGYVQPIERKESKYFASVRYKSRTRTEPGYWKCCNTNDPRGCKEFHRCCDKEKGSPGCEKSYDGCGHKQGSTPCRVRCKNCKKVVNPNYTNGCKDRCKNCLSHDPRHQQGCMNTLHSENMYQVDAPDDTS